jgi:ABC-2 type transport system permease protein
MTMLLQPLHPITPPSRPATQLIFVGRSLRHSVRNVDALIMAIALPVILMLLFVFIFGGAIAPDGRYVNYVVPGIILLCAGFGAAGTAVGVAEDMTNGVIDRFRTMPIDSGAVITGHVVASLVRNLVATAVVIGVALLTGFRPAAGVAGWIGALALVALWILAITWLFAAIGLVARSTEAAGNYGFALLFLPYLSSAFVPLATLPSGLRWIAEHQPLTPIIESIRGLLLGTEQGAVFGSTIAWALGWSAGILVAAMVWARWLFRRRAGRR